MMFKKMSRHRAKLETILNSIVVYGNVLDIGGLQKSIIGRISSKSEILEYKILDLPHPHTKTLLEADISFDIQSTDMSILDAMNLNFDAIFCIEVSLYWSNPVQALCNISRLMTEDSILYINFHQNYAVQKPNNLDSLRYTDSVVQKYFSENDLIVVDVVPTYLNNLSKIALNIFWRSEKMRKSKIYKYHYVSSIFYKVRKST